MKKVLTILVLLFPCICFSQNFNNFFFEKCNFSEKYYIEDSSIDMNALCESFNVHVGGNEWIETSTIYRDKTGTFTFQSDIKPSVISVCEYEKKWKCPYCYSLYPIGRPCSKADCPSKYR